ncbi:hypothetical protein Taro_021304, partial [Colocasia esculenta]|nr:hypothetical protein [Colocasia esculenta]
LHDCSPTATTDQHTYGTDGDVLGPLVHANYQRVAVPPSDSCCGGSDRNSDTTPVGAITFASAMTVKCRVGPEMKQDLLLFSWSWRPGVAVDLLASRLTRGQVSYPVLNPPCPSLLPQCS